MIRIKVAILDADSTYVERLATAFNTNYQDKIEVYSFSDKNLALDAIDKNNIEVLIASERFEISAIEISSKCAFAYFTEINSVETVNGEKAICKYQKVDLIYKEILAIFSEKSNYSVSINGDAANRTPIKAFIAFAGGVGTSTVAVAYATRCSNQGKKVFYLNLEEFGGAGLLLSGDGNMNLSDVIYSVKGRKSNLALKIESAVKRNHNGVCYIDSANLPLDVAELNEDDVLTLIDTIVSMREYDELILDFDFNINKLSKEILLKSDEIIFVNDGSETANKKTVNGINSLQIIEKQLDTNILAKSRLFYNKFSSKTGEKIENINIDVIGGSSKYEGYSSQQITENLSNIKEFDLI